MDDTTVLEGTHSLSDREHTESVETKVFKRRWYVLGLFSLMCCHQCSIWNTYGPIETSIKYAYDKTWTNTTVAMMANWGTIMFITFVVPICWTVEKYGLRASCLLSTGLMAIGSILRVFSTKDLPYLISSHVCSIMNGISGIVVMAAPSAISAVWFPPNERTTATAISQVANGLGNGVSFLLGPYLIPDNFLNASSTIPEVLTNYSGPVPSKHEVRQQIWIYMVIDAAVASFIFISMIIYFPAKPKIPPSQSASDEVERTDFFGGLKAMVTNINVLLSCAAYWLPMGIQGAWAGVMTVNFNGVGVGDKESGYIGMTCTVVQVVAGLIMARFTDRFRRHIKVTLIGVSALCTASYIWLLLIILKVLPYQAWQLWMSTLIGGALLPAAAPLMFEYTCELSFPVPEGVVGGFLTAGNNFIGTIFLCLFFVKNLDVSWMNYSLVIATFIVIPLLTLTKGSYSRLDLDTWAT